VRRVLEIGVAAALAFALPPAAELLGMQIAGSLWLGAGLTAPWLSQAGDALGALIAGVVVGGICKPLYGARLSLVVGACLAAGLAYILYPPAALLVAPIAAGGVVALQGTPALRVRGAAFAGALTAMAHLLPFPVWTRVALCLGAGLALSAGRWPRPRKAA
jgi:hypothetical protein